MTIETRPTGVRDFAEYQDYLSTLAERCIGPKLRSRVDPPDLVQQTILRAYQGGDRFRGESPCEVRAWLRTILGNLITDAIRRSVGRAGSGRERSLDDEAGSAVNLAALLIDDISTPSHKARRREAEAGLAAALQRLPEDQRLAVRLRHLDDLPLAEVAERMGRSVASAAGLIRRGLDGLRSDDRLRR